MGTDEGSNGLFPGLLLPPPVGAADDADGISDRGVDGTVPPVGISRDGWSVGLPVANDGAWLGTLEGDAVRCCGIGADDGVSLDVMEGNAVRCCLVGAEVGEGVGINRTGEGCPFGVGVA